MSQEQRIKSEYDRLSKYFTNVDESKRETVQGLLLNASFMGIILEDLQQSIIANGTTSEYKNGQNQYGTKASAELQCYNSTLKNYSIVIKQLLALLPADVEVKQSFGLMLKDMLADL